VNYARAAVHTLADEREIKKKRKENISTNVTPGN
jgi:hypothetical protein